MSSTRIDEAMARLNAAMARIETARLELASSGQDNEPGQDREKTDTKPDSQSSARVMALVNAHEKLREEVADTLGELDTLIEELEGE